MENVIILYQLSLYSSTQQVLTSYLTQMHLCPLSLEQCIPESLLVIAVYFEASQP